MRGAPAFEASLRRRVRAELRKSPELWREYKIHRKVRRPRQYTWLLRLLGPLLVCSAVLGGRASILVGLSILTLYATGSAFLRAVQLLRGLWVSGELLICAPLPIPDEDFFRYQWRRFLAASAWMLWAFAVVYVLIAIAPGRGPDRAVPAFLLASAQWAVLVGSAAALAAWFPRRKLSGIGLSFCIAAIALAFARTPAREILESTSGRILLALPAGWVGFAFLGGVLRGAPLALAWAAPAAAGLALLVLAKRRLAAGYRLREIHMPRPAAELLLEQEVRSALERESRETPADPAETAARRDDYYRAMPLANVDSIRDRAFLTPDIRPYAGPLERLFARWLTARERSLAEVMMGPKLGLRSKFKTGALVSGFGVAFALLDRGRTPVVHAVVAIVLGLLLLDAGWPGFRLYSCAGKFMPAHAVWPVGYREVSRLYFKLAAVRILAWLPLGLAYGAAAGSIAPMLGPWGGMEFALKVAWLAAAAQPLLMAGRYSSGTNDTSPLTARGCFGLLLPAAGVMVPLLGSLAGLFTLSLPFSILSGAGMALVSLGFWAYYGFLYERCRLDVLRSTPSSGQGGGL